MTPIKSEGSFTIPIAILAGLIEDGLGAYLSLIMMIIIVLTAILTLLVKMIGGNKFSHMPFIQNLFDVNTFWVITRIVAAVFAVMVKFKLGTEAIYKIGRASCRERV